MKVTNKMDDDTINALGSRIVDLIASYPDPELSQGEIVTACMIVIASIVQSIECPGCRKLAARHIKKAMPRFIAGALVVAAQSPSRSDHVH